MNAWMLVRDTKGTNVWYASGNGTFCTDELVKRITEAKLDIGVNHRWIILPQIGAVGVCKRSQEEIRLSLLFRSCTRSGHFRIHLHRLQQNEGDEHCPIFDARPAGAHAYGDK